MMPAGEAPVGIEPTNRGFAVAQERLRATLSRSVQLHQSSDTLGNAAARCELLTVVVPHLCPGADRLFLSPGVRDPVDTNTRHAEANVRGSRMAREPPPITSMTATNRPFLDNTANQ